MINIDKTIDITRQVIKEELTNIFEEEVIPNVKDLIIEAYEVELEDVVTSGYDNIKPEAYKDIFIEKLDQFEYVNDTDDTLSLVCPSMETFDFDDGLNFIYNILVGLVGNYYKVPATWLGYENESVYICSEDNPAIEYIDLSNLDLFEFSNSPPIDIFVDANLYIKENMNGWIKQANSIAVERIESYRDGVI